MPIFTYKAMAADGRTITADMEADNRNALMQKLRQLSLSPLEIQEKNVTSTGTDVAFKDYFSRKKVASREITLFTTQLSALISAKMNLSKALNTLEAQEENNAMKVLIATLAADVNKGKNLSEAMEAYPRYFSSLYINMIKVGEVGGVLDKTLQRIVSMRARDEELLGKIKGALTYPLIMACVMLSSIVVMLTFVIPRFSGIFSQMGTSLPLATKIIIGLSVFLKSWWWLLLLLLVAVTITGMKMLRDEKWRLEFDRCKLRLPVLGRTLQQVCLSRYSLSMGALLSGGVSMMKALDATIPVTGNSFIEKSLREISREVREGGSLSSALRKRGDVFPSIMSGLIGTGEEAGNLDEMLNNVGEYFRKESESRINTITNLFEPVMIVVMGGIVAFIISAILLPIFDVSTSIH